MPIPLNELENMIKEGLPDSEVIVKDLVGDGDHLEATVISAEFEGKNLLAQHRIVNEILKEILKEQLHALKLKTYTPEQWEKVKS